LKVAQQDSSTGARRYVLFETLVRLHREGEGAPYTGLKPAGTVGHYLRRSDKATRNRLKVDALVKEKIFEHLSEGIRLKKIQQGF